MSTDPRPVVVGVDGSAAAVRAARWAASLAETIGAPVHIVCALHGVEQLMRDIVGAQLRPAPAAHEWAQEVVKHAEQAICAERPSVKIKKTLAQHGAAATLKTLGEQAAFVVLGADEVSPRTALLVGSTTVAVTTGAPCPVVAWRGERTALTKQPLVVGVDGSESGNAALAVAFHLADRLGVDIVAVHAWSDRLPVGEVTVPYVIDWDAIEDRHRQMLSDTLAPWQQRYPAVQVTQITERSKAAEAVLGNAGDAQLIVVGNRGHGVLRSVLVGSTTLNLLHHAQIPVLVCHAGQ